MAPTVFNKTALTLMLSLLALPIVSGCTNTVKTQHQEAVQKADTRWKTIRSKLLLQMAQRQFDTGDLDAAEKSVGDALTIDQTDAEVYILAGRIALERGALERSWALFETAIKIDPTIPRAYYNEGIVLQRWQRFDDALTCYKRAYELKADDPAYLLAACEMLVATGEPDRARELLKSKLAYFDQNAGIRIAIAQIGMCQGDFAQAAEYFAKALVLVPEDAHVRENLALAQIAASQGAQAVETLLPLVAMTADRPALQRMLASAYRLQGRLPSAKNVLIQLVQKDPASIQDWQQLGEVCWKLHDADGLGLAAQRLIALAPQKADGYLLRALAHQQKGDFASALESFQTAAELAPSDPMPLVLWGLTLERMGDKAAAKRAYSHALERKPDNARARQLLAALAEDGN